MLVLPGAPSARFARSTVVLIGGALLAFAAVAAFVLARVGPRSESKRLGEDSPNRASIVNASNDAGPLVVPAQGSGARAAQPAPGVVVAPAAVTPAEPAEHSATENGPNRPPPSDVRPTPAAPAAQHAAEVARSASPEAPRPSAPATQPPTVPATARGNGELAIIVRPWAAIWLNGKPLADGTPYRAQVPAGRYRIRIANDDLNKAESLTVTVEPHKTTIVERRW